jgi:succinate dehydrogenase / fumarate reductase flavoprotein subunit
MTQAYEIIEHSYDVVIIGAGGARLDYRPVHMQPLSNDVATIPPKERVY